MTVVECLGMVVGIRGSGCARRTCNSFSIVSILAWTEYGMVDAKGEVEMSSVEAQLVIKEADGAIEIDGHKRGMAGGLSPCMVTWVACTGFGLVIASVMTCMRSRRVTFGIVGVCIVFRIVKRVGGVENELGSRKIQHAASKIMSIGCGSEGRWSGYWIWRRKSMRE